MTRLTLTVARLQWLMCLLCLLRLVLRVVLRLWRLAVVELLLIVLHTCLTTRLHAHTITEITINVTVIATKGCPHD